MDRHTLFSAQGGLLLFLAAVVYFAFLERRRRRGDTSADWFALGFACAGVGLLLQSYRDMGAPPFLTIIVGNGLFIFFGACFNRALARLAGVREHFWLLIAIDAAVLATFGYFTFVHPSVLLRTMEALVWLQVQWAAIVWVTGRNRDPVIQPAMRCMRILVSTRMCLDLLYLLCILRPRFVTLMVNGLGVITVAGVALAFLWVEILRMTHELEVSATTDPLTDLLNRRGLEQAAIREQSRAVRYKQPCAALSLDINTFKQINDVWGHAAGDQALCAVAATMRATLREEDIIARLGGDEFFVLLPNTGLAEAQQAAARIRAAVALLELTTFYEQRFKITISVGAAALSGDRVSLAELMHASDIVLYQEKACQPQRARHAPEVMHPAIDRKAMQVH